MGFEDDPITLMINFVDDFNNREMICHEKSSLQVDAKLDIISDFLY